MTDQYDVVIIGGGISGLSAAYFLERHHPNLSALLIEASPRLGGWVQTITLPSGQQYEAGPRSLRLRGEYALATVDLITSLGLEQDVLKASPAASSRYVILNGRPVALPEGFLDLIRTPVGRELAKKMFLEPFQKRGTVDDESVASFFSRRAPSPIVNKLANALVSGIWGGEASRLSIYNTFPDLKEADVRYGSCLIGGIASLFQKKERPKIRGMCSFSKGIEQLAKAMSAQLRMPILTDTTVQTIDLTSSSIELHFSQGTVRANKVILALPEPAIRQLLPSFFGNEQAVPHASFATVVMGWKEDGLPRKGFGILAPSSEEAHVLGIVFDSCVFPEQNTHMKTRLTAILGGTRWPAVNHQSDETLFQIASSAVASWTGMTAPCAEYSVIRSPSAIPQHPVGSRRLAPYRLSSCGRVCAIAPSIGGVSVNQCITAGSKAASWIQ